VRSDNLEQDVEWITVRRKAGSGGPVIHFALYRAGNLHWLQLGFERPREGTLDHAFEPALEATENSHRGTSFPYPHPMVSALRVLLRTC